MQLNANLTVPVVMHGEALPWVPSPAPGVDRRMLFRIGEEVARATSIVRYAPGSRFPRHTHSGGEEILVLDGVFQDEHGDYPAGSYFRNPPGTSHVPASASGCTIFVRLWQFRTEPSPQIVRHPGEGDPAPLRDGATSARLLFADAVEAVLIEDWAPNARIRIENAAGLELLVVSGAFDADSEHLPAKAWTRLPAGHDLDARVGPDGARVWLKLAPLFLPDICPLPDAG